ncbi:hypothetical protein Pmar_PMAR015203 [Perkinsus marinus ATCC 50983]|uniref:Uncharacterized protein n=1 Tax=Perkinsus marinus (strain ATCC 50983 / TXsc) TaxID=423536 RepID=C5K5P7_PERM5|nr:hypothetical protein Pmar_PMAR015203 [Perkinsus marinus ATCC 50983]EER20204.1 hypothetical protein Pmar_PMAR015203 [Perkinsus marinus ATCC 50983]|eukprot:XP_002788408.1 hypothetical protein Pmar_PMAR015203 [Perkinsus marinus ATCC 50983]
MTPKESLRSSRRDEEEEEEGDHESMFTALLTPAGGEEEKDGDISNGRSYTNPGEGIFDDYTVYARESANVGDFRLG